MHRLHTSILSTLDIPANLATLSKIALLHNGLRIAQLYTPRPAT